MTDAAKRSSVNVGNRTGRKPIQTPRRVAGGPLRISHQPVPQKSVSQWVSLLSDATNVTVERQMVASSSVVCAERVLGAFEKLGAERGCLKWVAKAGGASDTSNSGNEISVTTRVALPQSVWHIVDTPMACESWKRGLAK